MSYRNDDGISRISTDLLGYAFTLGGILTAIVAVGAYVAHSHVTSRIMEACLATPAA